MSVDDRTRRVLYLKSLTATGDSQTEAPSQPAPPAAQDRRGPGREKAAGGSRRKQKKLGSQLAIAPKLGKSGVELLQKSGADLLQKTMERASRGAAGAAVVNWLQPNTRTASPLPTFRNVSQIDQFPGQLQAAGFSRGQILSFIVCVVLPVLFSAIYYIFIASHQYVAEFRFAVTDSSPASGASLASGFGAALGVTSGTTSQNYLVADFLTTRQAVDELQQKVDAKKLYSKPSIDWWSRFNASRPIEDFIPYWQRMVSASFDQVTGLATAQVRAFSADDAHAIASALVELAEKLVNDIATRPQREAVRYAENEVKRSEERLKAIRAELTKYRDKESVIDPNSSVVTSNVSLAQTLRASLSQLQTELASLSQQQINPNAPTIQVLQSRITATKAQLANVESQISKTSDGSRALSSVVGQYEQLDLERQFAQTMLTSTMQTLENARANAAAQHLYITPYVRPSVPESATYPKVFNSILTVAVSCFLVWMFGALFVRSMRERL